MILQMAAIRCHQKQTSISTHRRCWMGKTDSANGDTEGRTSSDSELSYFKTIHTETEEVLCCSSQREVPVLKNMQCKSQGAVSGNGKNQKDRGSKQIESQIYLFLPLFKLAFHLPTEAFTTLYHGLRRKGRTCVYAHICACACSHKQVVQIQAL